MAGGASKGALVKLYQGNLTDFVARGICVECSDNTENSKSRDNCAQMVIIAHVEQTNGSKRTLTICVEYPWEK